MQKIKAVSFFDRAYGVVKRIPAGKVATYGQVAAILKNPRAARTVGWALNGLPERLAGRVPWHRVINAEGRISNSGGRHGGAEEQLRRLKKEGIKFDKTGRCDLRKFLWEPPHRLHKFETHTRKRLQALKEGTPEHSSSRGTHCVGFEFRKTEH